MKVVLLSGGTGGAKLAAGCARLLQRELSIIVNTGDDEVFHGLHVSPDIDAVMYRLCGRFNETAGFGVAGDTFNALSMLHALGEETWFQLGDTDIGLQLARGNQLSRGVPLSQAVAHCAGALGIAAAVIPMSDDPVRTRVLTDSGELSLQQWFVRDRCEPPVRAVRIDGADTAAPAAAAVQALASADVVIIGPSNPFISIDPILAVLRDALASHRVIGISPLVRGVALKGPTALLFREMGAVPSAAAVAAHYDGLLSDFVIDHSDADEARMITGVRLHRTGIVMNGSDGEDRLARELMDIIES